MATTEHACETTSRNRVAIYVLTGVAAVAISAVLIQYFNRPPQMGVDDEVFLTVNALYTAVRLKDEARVARCAERLRGYREAGKLPAKPADYLDGIIAKARSGQWEAATERLYDFMLAQRREGTHSHSAEKHGAPPPKSKTGSR